MAKIERTKNASRNIIFGIILKIYQILVPFLMRTAMIYLMGVQYLGLNSLFTSVLQVLNLAELGVGSAMVYSMYKPIAEDDETTICALMKLYRTYYRVIGLIIAVVGCALTPFIPHLIKSDVPAGLNIYILYLLNLGATVLSYWLFAYKNSILQAHQRMDVVSRVTLITSTVQYVLQIAVLWIFHNYYLYVIVALATQALTNIITAYCANKLYSQFKPKGNVGKVQVQRINQRIRDLFTSKIGGIIYDSADTIVISAFLGLTVLAVYQNYFFILNSINGLIAVVFSACTAGIGNSIVVESKEKNYQDLKKFTFIITWIAGFCSVCLLCIYQPFMELWTGKDLMLSLSAVVCFVVYFFVRQFNALFNLYKDASGMWHEDRYRPLAAALTNLVLNLVLVQFIGIYGILLSTVLAILCVGMPWLLHNLFTVIFDKKHMWHYIKRLAKYVFVILFSCVVTYLVCSRINIGLIPTILIRGMICVIVPNAIYFLVFRKTEEYSQALHLLNNMTKGRINKVLVKLGMN
ncbi:oligosaccharide flippase family protein [Ruminococcus sp.]|uniref:lipopolysaccharide biosynthesis protein n=1 Tax=Ruminococcus sp. TaxID=41978 RepID=UPI00260F5003|nr:oligosaccharide flippase family protein [Ruminococcus sp.]MDD7556875.1 oligosaccharide flippase family protein [Ruminococcus sp.]